MKKKVIVVITIIGILITAFLIGTGFQKRTDVVLVKDEETGEWIRPRESDIETETKELFTIEKLISLCDEGSEALKNTLINFNDEGELP